MSVKPAGPRFLITLLVAISLITKSLHASAGEERYDHAKRPSESDTGVPELVNVIAFICADSGSSPGRHELGAVQAAMTERESLNVSHCSTAYVGNILHADGNQQLRVLAVTTGIGYISAALCSANVLRLQHEQAWRYTHMVFIGTAGMSPMVGGLNPTNTSHYREEQKHSTSKNSVRDDVAGDVNPVHTPTRSADLLAKDKPLIYRSTEHVNFELLDTREELSVDGCSPRRADTQKVAVGSVCVTSGAFIMSFSRGGCTETLSTSQCSRPQCSGWLDEGGLSNHLYMNDTLAKAITASSMGKDFPPLPDAVRRGLKAFWAAHEVVAESGESGDRTTRSQAPHAASLVPCAESTGNNFHTGAMEDYLCREYTAHTLNLNSQSQDFTSGERVPLYTADNVVCAQAMESFAFLQLIQKYPEIPVAIIRTASNYDMFPLQKRYLTPEEQTQYERSSSTMPPNRSYATNDGQSGGRRPRVGAYVWHQNPRYISQEEQDAFVSASFYYSVRTATFVLSNYFFGGRDLMAAPE